MDKYCRYCGEKASTEHVYCASCGHEFRGAPQAPNPQINENQLPQNPAWEQAPMPSPQAQMLEAPSIAATDGSAHSIKKFPNKYIVVIAAAACLIIVLIVAGIFLLPQMFSNYDGLQLQEMEEPLQPQEMEDVFQEQMQDDTEEASTKPAEPLPFTSVEIARLSSSVLKLYVYDGNREQIATGSGFVAFDDQTLVTSYHVISRGVYVEAVSEDDIRYNMASFLYYDTDADIAILQFETSTGIPVLPIADSSDIQVGEEIYTIGSPVGLKNTVSNGIVSAIRDPLDELREAPNSYDIQITAPVSPGSSGGALLNVFGQVIGIVYATHLDGQNLNLAIPSAEFIDLEFGEITPFLDVAQGYADENYFYDPHPIFLVNSINFNPNRVWFEDGMLIAEMHITNGNSHNVFNIRDIELTISNEQGIIAEGHFGALRDVVLGPGQSIVWMFIFVEDSVMMENADLSYLRTQSRCRNSF